MTIRVAINGYGRIGRNVVRAIYESNRREEIRVVWVNELGKGNSHTRNNIPFVMVGGGLGWNTGQAHDFKSVPHNRLLMTLSESMGHPVESFGNPDFCNDGPLTGLV